jgi:hypothetical protein
MLLSGEGLMDQKIPGWRQPECPRRGFTTPGKPGGNRLNLAKARAKEWRRVKTKEKRKEKKKKSKTNKS